MGLIEVLDGLSAMLSSIVLRLVGNMLSDAFKGLSAALSSIVLSWVVIILFGLDTYGTSIGGASIGIYSAILVAISTILIFSSTFSFSGCFFFSAPNPSTSLIDVS